MDLLTATVESLLLGTELDRAPWLDLATQLSQSGRSEEEEALLILARIVTVEELHELKALAESIPARHKLLAAVGRAVAATRALDATSSSSVNGLVRSIHSLLPYLRQQTHVQPAVERLARLQASAIEIGGDPLDLPAACMFASLANILAMSLGNPGYLDAALAMADRLHRCPAEPGRYGATSNLVTTCKQLAKYRPSEAERYLLRGVELASSLYDSRREFAQVCPDPSLVRVQAVRVLRNLVLMHADLARINPALGAPRRRCLETRVSPAAARERVRRPRPPPRGRGGRGLLAGPSGRIA